MARTFVWSTLLGLVCVGCQSDDFEWEPKRVSTQERAGSIQVAVVGVIPWGQIVKDLEPAFKLSAKDALDKVVPNTQFMTQQILDAFSASARLATPTSTKTTTETRNVVTNPDYNPGDPDGELPLDETYDREEKFETGPGDLSKVPDPGDPSGGRKAKDLYALDLSKQNPGVEPMHQHWNALALFQEVKLLNAMVRHAAQRYRYKPYVIRVKVSVTPMARHQPYDAYAMLSFFNGDRPSSGVMNEVFSGLRDSASTHGLRTKVADLERDYLREVLRGGRHSDRHEKDESPLDRARQTYRSDRKRLARLEEYLDGPKVVPLLVTDTAEATLRSRAEDTIRQFAFAMAAMQSGFAFDGSAARMTEQIDAVLGKDYNSLLTVGRASENTMQVRLGAQLQVGYKYATVPRTHNVTALLLVPEAYVALRDEPGMRLVAQTSMVDAETGCALPTRSHGNLEHRARDILARWLSCDPGADVRALMRAARRGSYRDFMEVLWQAPQFDEDRPDLELEHLWTEFVGLASNGPWTSTEFHLPRVPEFTQLEAEEGTKPTALILDDTKTTSMVTLGGITRLDDTASAVAVLTLYDKTEMNKKIAEMEGEKAKSRSDPRATEQEGDEWPTKELIKAFEDKYAKGEEIYRKTFKLSSTTISMNADGNLQIKFPSLKAWGYVPKDRESRIVGYASLKIYEKPGPWDAKPRSHTDDRDENKNRTARHQHLPPPTRVDRKTGEVLSGRPTAGRSATNVSTERGEGQSSSRKPVIETTYIRYLAKPKKEPPADPRFKMSVTAAHVVGSKEVDASKPEGRLSVYFNVKKKEEGEEPGPGPVIFQVLGPDARMVSHAPTGNAKSVPEKGEIHIFKSCRITLQFWNLVDGEKIVLKGKRKNVKQAHGDLTIPIKIRGADKK